MSAIRVVAAPLGRTLAVAAVVVIACWLLGAALPREAGEEAPGLLDFVAGLGADRNDRPVLPLLAANAPLSLTLVGVALLVTLPLGLLAAAVAAWRPAAGTGLRLVIVLGASLPAVAIAPLAQREASASVWVAGAVLGLTDLGLAALASPLARGYRREMEEPWVLALAARGVWPHRYAWRRLAVAAARGVRTRLPVLLGGTIIVESIFSFDVPGIGALVLEAVQEAPDPNLILWVALGAVLLVQLATGVEELLRRTLTPEPTDLDGRGQVSDVRIKTANANIRDGRGQVSDVRIRTANANIRDLTPSAPSAASVPVPVPAPVPPPSARSSEARLELFVLIALGIPLLVIVAVAGLGLWPHDPDALVDLELRNAGPDLGGWSLLGRNDDAEDVASHVLRSIRTTLPPLLLATLLALGIGVTAGALWGYSPRSIPGRLAGLAIETIDAVPRLLIVLVAVAFFETDGYLYKVLPVTGITLAPVVAHPVRGAVADLVGRPFVEALVVLGVSRPAILLRHVLWNNARGPALMATAEVVAFLVLFDVTLGYLGHSQPDHLSLGGLIERGIRDVLSGDETINPLQAWGPLGAATLAVAWASVVAERLRTRIEEAHARW